MKLAVFALLYAAGGGGCVVAAAWKRRTFAPGRALGGVLNWAMLAVLWPLYAPFVWGEARDHRRALTAGGELALINDTASPP